MFGTTTKLSMLFKVLGLSVTCTLERIDFFIKLGPTTSNSLLPETKKIRKSASQREVPGGEVGPSEVQAGKLCCTYL